jgi:hypothetical protein
MSLKLAIQTGAADEGLWRHDIAVQLRPLYLFQLVKGGSESQSWGHCKKNNCRRQYNLARWC